MQGHGYDSTAMLCQMSTESTHKLVRIKATYTLFMPRLRIATSKQSSWNPLNKDIEESAPNISRNNSQRRDSANKDLKNQSQRAMVRFFNVCSTYNRRLCENWLYKPQKIITTHKQLENFGDTNKQTKIRAALGLT